MPGINQCFSQCLLTRFTVYARGKHRNAFWRATVKKNFFGMVGYDLLRTQAYSEEVVSFRIYRMLRHIFSCIFSSSLNIKTVVNILFRELT